MASDSTLMTLGAFMETTRVLNLLPFKFTSRYDLITTCTSKAWKFLTAYAIAGMSLTMAYFVKELVFHSGNPFTTQDYIFILFSISVCVTVLCTQAWTLIYLKDITEFTNCLIVLNKRIGEL